MRERKAAEKRRRAKRRKRREKEEGEKGEKKRRLDRLQTFWLYLIVLCYHSVFHHKLQCHRDVFPDVN